MDINYELYKVFYYVASTLSFFGSFQAVVYLAVGCQPVDQGIVGEKAGSDLIHPKHQESTSYYRRRDSSAPYRTGDQPDQAWGKPDFSMSAHAEDSFTSEPVIRSAVISWCLIWNASTGNFRERISRLRMRHRSSCVELLETGQVDLIVVNSPNSYLGNVPNVKKIKDFQDVFIANEAFKELKGKNVSFKELLDYPILIFGQKEYNQ